MLSSNLSGLSNIAVVFPGQGSQSVGMLKELSELHPIIIETFNTASSILGFDAWELAQCGPEIMLNQTENTQPLLLAADIALWRAMNASGSIQPAWLVGHSLGEYAALVAAESIRFEDGLRLVAERGRLMQEAVPEGAGSMAAILGLDNTLIQQACFEAKQNQIVSPVNYNSIGQTVIAGNTEAVMRAMELLKKMGAKRAILLPVSVPSHCALMKPAAEKLSTVLEDIEIRTPRISILHNSDVQSHSEPSEIRRVLCEQLYSPVRWVETVQNLSQKGITQFIECGPGKVLSGLIKRIHSDCQVYNIDTPTGLTGLTCLDQIV